MNPQKHHDRIQQLLSEKGRPLSSQYLIRDLVGPCDGASLREFARASGEAVLAVLDHPETWRIDITDELSLVGLQCHPKPGAGTAQDAAAFLGLEWLGLGADGQGVWLPRTQAAPAPSFRDLTAQLAERIAAGHEPPVCPVVETWLPGLYRRQVTMPPGLYVSMPHLTEHPFVITAGRVQVISETEGTAEYSAGHHGVTMPGTQRVLRVLEECTWTTYHATEQTTTEAVAAEILDLAAVTIPAELQGWRQPAAYAGNRLTTNPDTLAP